MNDIISRMCQEAGADVWPVYSGTYGFRSLTWGALSSISTSGTTELPIEDSGAQPSSPRAALEGGLSWATRAMRWH